MYVKSLQLCLTLCNSIDGPKGSMFKNELLKAGVWVLCNDGGSGSIPG